MVPSLDSSSLVRTAVNAGATVALVVGARSAGLTLRELGIDRTTWRGGARWGAVALAASTAAYLVVLAFPAGRAVLAEGPGGDLAVGGLSIGGLAVRALVLIPLGTVLAEEIAFRGVLLALARRQLSDRSAAVVTAVVFGLWHVGGALRTGSPVVAVVALTALGGLLLAWLRLRSGSLLAPVGLHLGANSVGLLAAAVAAR